jgi:hypothetical protein
LVSGGDTGGVCGATGDAGVGDSLGFGGSVRAVAGFTGWSWCTAGVAMGFGGSIRADATGILSGGGATVGAVGRGGLGASLTTAIGGVDTGRGIADGPFAVGGGVTLATLAAAPV